MRKIAEILEAMKKCNQAITDERKKGASVRDKVKVRKLQSEFRDLRTELAKAHEDDRVKPKDSSDKSEKPYKEKEEKDRLKKVKEWEEKQNKEQSTKSD